MIGEAIGHPPAFLVVATAVISILLALVYLGHALLGLLRDWRDFRDGF